MSEPVDTYSRRGFLFTAAFAAVVVGVGGWVAVLSAPEEVACRRSASRSASEVSCELTRLLASRVALASRVVEDLRAVDLQETRPLEGIGRPRSRGNASHRLRLVGVADVAFSVSSEVGELHGLRSEIERLRADPTTPEARARLSGSPGFHRWSVVAVVLGLSLVPLWVLGYFFPALRPNRGPSRV